MAATTTLPISRTYFEDAGDAPQTRKLEQSHDVLASTLKNEGLSAEAKDAITFVLAELRNGQAGDPKKPDDDDEDEPSKTTIGAVADVVGALPPVLIRRAVITLAAALAFVQPLVSNFAQSYFDTDTQLAKKLDAIIVSQAEDRAAQAEDRAADVKRDRNVATISAFVVASEKARREGKAPPSIPAMLSLMAAQDEVERTSGN